MRLFDKRVTLIELILVMVIFVLITGLAVTLYPNLRAQASIVNAIATIDELEKAIRTYETIEGKFPESFDSLHFDPTGLLSSTDLRPGFSELITSTTITLISSVMPGVSSTEVDFALEGAGFNVIIDNTPVASPSITFDFVTPDIIEEIFPETEITKLSATGITACGIVPPVASAVYLVFGIGAECTFVGTVPGISSAPLNESYIESENDYDLYYGRYLAIFEIKSTTFGVIDPIRLVKVISPSALPGGLGGTIENYKVLYDSF